MSMKNLKFFQIAILVPRFKYCKFLLSPIKIIEQKMLDKVLVTPEVWQACFHHALTTDTEEIM